MFILQVIPVMGNDNWAMTLAMTFFISRAMNVWNFSSCLSNCQVFGIHIEEYESTMGR